MSKRLRSLLLTACAALILGGAYAAILIFKPFEEKAEPYTPTVYPDPLVSVDSDKVVKVSVDGKGMESWTFARKGEELVLVEPSIKDPRFLPDEIQRLFSTMARVAPDELIYDPEAEPKQEADLKNFGLDDPRIVKAEYDDGTSFFLELGGRSPGGKFYGRKKGEGKIWTFSSWGNESFFKPLSDFRDRTLPQANPQDIAELSIVGSGVNVRMVRMEKQEDGFFMSSHKLLSPYPHPLPVDSEAFTKLVEKIPQFSIVSFVDDGAPLSSYGLSSPSLVLTLRDSEGGYRLSVGKPVPGKPGEVYAKMDEDIRVFTLRESDLDFSRGIEPFRLISNLPMLIQIDTVDYIIMEYGGKKRTLTLTRGPKPEKEDEEREEKFFSEGRPIEDKDFRQAYQAIIGIALEGNLLPELKATVDKKPMLTITYIRNEGLPPLKYSLYRASRDFLSFGWTPDVQFAVSSSQVEANLAKIDALLGEAGQ